MNLLKVSDTCNFVKKALPRVHAFSVHHQDWNGHFYVDSIA